MTKFFVHYSKTKAEFIAAGLPATYTNNIVFIKGDANGNGSCIYTHGTYFANFAEFLAAINYVKGISVGGQQYNAALGGGYVAFGAKDPSTVAVNVGQNGVEIGLTDAFVNKVNSTSTDLGTKDDAANSSGSAFARIANLAKLVSDLTGGSVDSIEGQITNAINALRTEIVGTLDTDDAKTLQSINDELDSLLGTSADTSSTMSLHGVKKKVEELQDSLIGEGGQIPALAEAVQQNADDIATLNGNDTTEGSVDKKIKDAINDFATKATDNGTIDTFKELVDYVAGVDGSATLATAIAQINSNKGAIETLNGGNTVAGSVDKKVKDAIDAEVSRANGAYATKAQGEKADTAYQKPATGIPYADLDSAVQQSLGLANNAFQGIEVVDDDIYAYLDTNMDRELSVHVHIGSVADGETGLANSKDVKAYVDGIFAWEEL